MTSTDRTSRACEPFLTSRPITPFSAPWTTSTIMPSRMSGHGSNCRSRPDPASKSLPSTSISTGEKNGGSADEAAVTRASDSTGAVTRPTRGSLSSPRLKRHISPDWTLVYFDDRSVVYLRSLERYDPIIKRDGYRLISPALAGQTEISNEEAPAWLAEVWAEVLGTPRVVQVYSQHAPQPAVAQGDRVLIMGSIIDSPATNLTGYLGTLTQVVWGGLAVRLDGATQP